MPRRSVPGVSAQADLDLRVLEYVYANDRGMEGPAELAGLYEIAGGEGPGHRTAHDLEHRGFLESDGGLAGGWHITTMGRARVEEVRIRRTDRRERRVECREQFLRWLDQEGALDAGSRKDRQLFSGMILLDPFEEAEVIDAVNYLYDNGMIESLGQAGNAPHLLVWTTDLGRECVDSGQTIAHFVAQQRGTTGAPVVQVSGNSNVVTTTTGGHATVSVNVDEFDHEAVAQVAAAVRKLAAREDLPAEIAAALKDIEQRDNPTLAAKAASQVYLWLAGTASGAVGTVLAPSMAHVLHV